MHPHPRSADDRSKAREEARAYLLAKVAAPDPEFSTYDPAILRADAAWRLRWIDCAPDGAWHQVAPLQDKHGVPCGCQVNENLGPCQALRDARAARGIHPIAGLAA